MKRWFVIAVLAIGLAAGALAVFINQQNNQSAKNQNTTQTEPSEASAYLYIKEWGVRLKLPSNLQNQVVYAIKPDGDIAYLTSKTLSNMPESSCVINASKDKYGSRVLISRSTERPVPNSDIDEKVAGKWYQAINSGGGLCNSSSDGSAESDFVSQIINSYKSMEAVN